MNKVALITGSSRGIGRAIALQLAKDGYDIIIHYKTNKQKADEVLYEVENLWRKWFLIQSDIVDYINLEKIFEDLYGFTDHIDVLVNNVGFDYDKSLEDYPIEEIQSVIDMVLTSKLVLTKLALPFLKKNNWAHVINIASRLWKSSVIPWVLPYASAEAWVIRFSEFCVAEMSKKYGIRFNTVAPWLTDTDYSRLYITNQVDWDSIASRNPSGRVWKPEDIANIISFLCSEKWSYINGECIQVTGWSQFS
jgi:3-oxoacyl-[acyl-carrier protein] reductase